MYVSASVSPWSVDEDGIACINSPWTAKTRIDERDSWELEASRATEASNRSVENDVGPFPFLVVKSDGNSPIDWKQWKDLENLGNFY